MSFLELGGVSFVNWLGSRFSWSCRIGKAQARLGYLASTGKAFQDRFCGPRLVGADERKAVVVLGRFGGSISVLRWLSNGLAKVIRGGVGDGKGFCGIFLQSAAIGGHSTSTKWIKQSLRNAL